MTKIGVCHFYPSAKSRRELKIKTLGVIFQGESIAPPKQAACRFSDETFFEEMFIENFHNFFFRYRKMKCPGSSETRFPKSLRPNGARVNGRSKFSMDNFSGFVRRSFGGL